MKNSLLLHKHLIIRAEVNNPPKNVDTLTEWFKSFIDSINMKIMLGPYVAYCNNEPVPALMQFDVYSCADFDPYKIADKLKEDFDVVKIDYKFLNRETGLKNIRIKKDK